MGSPSVSGRSNSTGRRIGDPTLGRESGILRATKPVGPDNRNLQTGK